MQNCIAFFDKTSVVSVTNITQFINKLVNFLITHFIDIFYDNNEYRSNVLFYCFELIF